MISSNLCRHLDRALETGPPLTHEISHGEFIKGLWPKLLRATVPSGTGPTAPKQTTTTTDSMERFRSTVPHLSDMSAAEKSVWFRVGLQPKLLRWVSRTRAGHSHGAIQVATEIEDVIYDILTAPRRHNRSGRKEPITSHNAPSLLNPQIVLLEAGAVET